MTQPLDCSIIIVNYNTFTIIKNVISSVFEKTENVSYEIIVIDNNSPDGSGNKIREYYSDKIIFIQSEENIGFGRANNEGIKIAKGRNILFLNPDTILINNAIKILSDYLDKNEKVGVVGGNLYDGEDNPNHSYMKYLPSILWELDILFHMHISKTIWSQNYYFNHSENPQKVGYITGADMMVRKSILEEVGCFDEDFFLYFEETELTYRIRKKNYKIMSIPAAKITHLEGQCLLSNDHTKLKYTQKSRQLYYKKTHSPFQCFIINHIYNITCISRILIFTLLGRKNKRDYWKTLFQLNNNL